MKDIVFTASFGHEQKIVTLSQPAGGGGYHIYIDKHYYGVVIKRQGKWYTLPQNSENFTSDDLDIIAEIVASAD